VLTVLVVPVVPQPASMIVANRDKPLASREVETVDMDPPQFFLDFFYGFHDTCSVGQVVCMLWA